MFIRLAVKSLLNRKGSVLLTWLAMTVSLLLVLGVEHIKQQARTSFANTVSGTDLIVGAPTGHLNLLLYSVFHLGTPTRNIRWETYQALREQPGVDWALPISLGDSHQGYRVIGTAREYFNYFRYGRQHALQFHQGRPFQQVFDVVLGYDVAEQLGYQLGDEIVLSHGLVSTHFSRHDNHPFQVSGILAPTGTPVDRALYISLPGMAAIHRHDAHQHDPDNEQALTPASVTAVMLGLKSRQTAFKIQRTINNGQAEPLLAILPGVALTELWQMMSGLENLLRLIAILVIIATLLGLSAMLLASIRERSREIQLLRMIGAPPIFLFMLIELEAILIYACSLLTAFVLLYIGLTLASDHLAARFGLYISQNPWSENSLSLLVILLAATLLAAAIPSFSAYGRAR